MKSEINHALTLFKENIITQENYQVLPLKKKQNI